MFVLWGQELVKTDSLRMVLELFWREKERNVCRLSSTPLLVSGPMDQTLWHRYNYRLTENGPAHAKQQEQETEPGLCS